MPDSAETVYIRERSAIPQVDPEHYGAVGDGVADDTIPVQTALTFASNSGMTCILTTGKTYKITSELYLWGRANLVSWQTTTTAFGSLRFSTAAKQFLVNPGISGDFLPQEPWSGTIKNCDFTMVSVTGGTLGAITWGANFSLAGAFVNPANTKNRSITFINNSIPGVTNNWRELYRTAADVAN